MATLTRASEQLFERSPDERFESLAELKQHCERERTFSSDLWRSPAELTPTALEGEVTVRVSDEGDDASPHRLNDWSFTQLCGMAGVPKAAVNRLTPRTATQVLAETLPGGAKPMQLLAAGSTIRSLHGPSYTRLWNVELLAMLDEFAGSFTPPQKGCGGATGLYCGEQDLFVFLIDPTGWTEIGGKAFAPGFFVWNSEVGRRSLGVQTFWFQSVCNNHIVWDAVETVEFTRKHTANVGDGLREIRRLIERLVAKRDERRDAFARVLSRAMTESLGADAEEAMKTLTSEGVPRGLAMRATDLASQSGRLTIFSLVDALTLLAQQTVYAGERAEVDARVGSLLALAA